MKTILSFDIGEITLTYCNLIVDENKKFNIMDWKLSSIRNSSKNTSTDKIDILLNFLQTCFPKDNLIDIVLIEHQGNFRPFMKSIQMVIYAYFKLQNKEVKIMHAINKSKTDIINDNLKLLAMSGSKYKNNKTLSKLYIESIIPKECIAKFVLNKDCFDDYSDALFQAIYYIYKNM